VNLTTRNHHPGIVLKVSVTLEPIFSFVYFEFEHDNRHSVDVSANEKRLFTIQLRDIEESVMRSYQVLYFIFTGSLPVFRLEFTPAS
jgi:hypothetical protein